MWTRIVAWYATKQASTWLLGIGLSLAFGLIWYVDELRDFKKLCKQAQADQQRYSQIIELYEREIKRDVEAENEVIANSGHDCLGVTLRELLDGED